ncbi:hypothetical protein AgCh_028647 [Apium graveolens]
MLKVAKVRNILHNSLDNVMSKRVIAYKTAKKIWDALETQCQGKEKGLVAEYENRLSQDDIDDIDELLDFLCRRLKFKKNFEAAKSNRNMQKYFELLNQRKRAFITKENDWAADELEEDEDTSYVNLALMAKLDETEDSRCSRNMTGDSTLLTEFKERAGPSITFGDDSKGYIVGYGFISKDNAIIEEVALVNGLKHNLLSISRLCDNGN